MVGNQSLPVLTDHVTERINSEWEEPLNLLNAIFSFHMSQLNNVRSIALFNGNNIARAAKESGVPLGDYLHCTNKTVPKNKHKNYQRNGGYKQVAHARAVHAGCRARTAPVWVSPAAPSAAQQQRQHLPVLLPDHAGAPAAAVQPQNLRKALYHPTHKDSLHTFGGLSGAPVALPHCQDKAHPLTPSGMHATEFPASGNEQGGKMLGERKQLYMNR